MRSTDSVQSLTKLKAAQDAAHQLTSRALNSLFLLWRHEQKGAIQTSRDKVEAKRPNYRPTATFHVISAYAETGVWLPSSHYVASKSELKTPYLTVKHVRAAPPEPEEALQGMLEGGGAKLSGFSHKDKDWVSGVLSRSSHAIEGSNAPRILITFERLVAAVNALMTTLPSEVLSRYESLLRRGLLDAEGILRSVVTTPNGGFADPRWIADTGRFSTMIHYRMLVALEGLSEWAARLALSDTDRELTLDERVLLFDRLKDVLSRQLDHYMARQGVQRDPTYDPVSLAFALRGLHVANPDLAEQSFFDACIHAVIEGQLKDGCWPDGASFTTSETADVVQQPSVEVALLLAECLISGRKSLADITPRSTALLDVTRVALSRMAEYLHATFTTTEDGRMSGWSSDRIRRPRFVETWITALSARFLWQYWLVESSALRAHSLHHLGVLSHTGDDGKIGSTAEQWFDNVIEPDAITRPVETIWRRFVHPIVDQRISGRVIQRPAKSAVSMIIFGPPGSGKTFFVSRVAEFLGWPLVTITPGHFIEHGLEAIEAVAAEIFEHLHALEHAVIFFDECDELFRQRESGPAAERGILSFATASMLPKLQNLHDAERVMFILGTNYVRNIDAAVRRPGRFDEILMFDRPDEAARRALIRRARSGRSAAVTDNELVVRTSGFMAKEVQQAAAEPTGAVAEVSIDDYVEWCERDGPAELKAAGVAERVRLQVLDRWKRVIAGAVTR